IKRLEDDRDELEVIFSVDIFNEGVDIPSVNSVLMLRPTNSPIVFIQQLGRGLRKHASKSFLTVLDFIGNHSKVFLIALALN
ncbi:helicase-related protein, partial [Escherichia coli]|uniref:helicase-related protein n=3 Tax=Bacteria TaxID=2 RepID=UPI00223E3EE3